MAVVGVVPAAGYATRLQPISDSKEMLQAGGVPLMTYLVERMKHVHCDEIRVVTRREKTDVRHYAERQGLKVVIGRPESAGASIALGVQGLAADDVLVFGFPDTYWEPPCGFEFLVRALEREAAIVLGVFEGAEPWRCDTVCLDAADRVISVAVKDPNPRSTLIWGAGAARVGALAGIGLAGDPGLFFDQICGRVRIQAIRLSDTFVDAGTPQSLSALRALLAEREPGRG